MALRIMVVDDEPAVLKLIKGLIEQLGYEVLAFSDSREAALRINAERFDGILLDGNMPHLDGFALTQKLRSSPANSSVPIVMLTGDGDAETMRKAFKAGITFFLSKPVSLERLSGLVRVMRGPMLKERRRYARLPYCKKVACRSGTREFQAQSVDISERGILMEGTDGINRGDELGLGFVIGPAARTVRVQAKVVRKEASGRIGLEFINLDAEARVAIQNFIAGRTAG